MLGWDWLPSQTYCNVYVDIGSAPDSLPDDIASISISLFNVARVELSSD